MTQPWPLLAFVLVCSCPWIWVRSEFVCQERVFNGSGNLDKQSWGMRDVCCKGYVGSPGNCRPRCSPRCVNALCTAPQECTCNDGYEPVGGAESSTVGCQPKCHDCRFGDCISPGVCHCWPAFTKQKPLQGCQPIEHQLLPADRCLTEDCSCFVEHFRWTPLLAVAPKCVSICHREQLTKHCLRLDHCLCNSINHLLVCQGPGFKLPQQFACKVVKRMASTADRTYHTDPTNDTVSFYTDRKEQLQADHRVRQPNRKQLFDIREQTAETAVIRKEQAARLGHTVKIQHTDRWEKQLTNRYLMDHTVEIPHIDRKEQLADRNQNDDRVHGTNPNYRERIDHIRRYPFINRSEDMDRTRETTTTDYRLHVERTYQKYATVNTYQESQSTWTGQKHHVNGNLKNHQENHKEERDWSDQADRIHHSHQLEHKPAKHAHGVHPTDQWSYTEKQPSQPFFQIHKRTLSNQKDFDSTDPMNRMYHNKDSQESRSTRSDSVFKRTHKADRIDRIDSTRHDQVGQAEWVLGEHQAERKEQRKHSGTFFQATKSTPVHQTRLHQNETADHEVHSKTSDSSDRDSADKENSGVTHISLWMILFGCFVVLVIFLIGIFALYRRMKSPFHSS